MRTIPLVEIPLVTPGDDIGDLLLSGIEKQGIELEEGDVIVICQSIVSKAEGNVVDLSSIDPGSQSRSIAKKIGKDPRKVEVILSQTDEIVRLDRVLISQTKHGFICANSGVDSSNVDPGEVTVLPEDPDGSARRIRRKLREETGKDVVVVISDSWGRPFRRGAVGFAIGVSGIEPLVDLAGRKDAYGRKLKTTKIAPPDSLAAIASLEMGEADERTPAVLIKDASYEPGEGSISKLIRPEEEDLFR